MAKMLFKEVKIGSDFFKEFSSGRWILYKKIDKNHGEIVALSEKKDNNAIGNVAEFTGFELVSSKG